MPLCPKCSAPQQMANESKEEVIVFVYGAPPERAGADAIDSAV